MSERLHPKLSVLPAAQRSIWPELRQASSGGFVLYGGTAVALRLGHRVSVDFDLFTERPLDRSSLTWPFALPNNATAIQETEDTLSLLVASGDAPTASVKLSFFGNVDMGRVGIPDLTADGVLQVASLNDLMATKLKVMLQRAEAKDYRDVVAILQAGVNLAEGLGGAQTLFGSTFQPSESLKALTFYEDGDLATLDEHERAVLIKAVRDVTHLPVVPLLSRSLAAPAV